MSAASGQGLKHIARSVGGSFAPLRLRSLRIYLGGQAISLMGTWMQVTAQAWTVWQLSHSNTALGLVGMLGMLPYLLLGPWVGVWADRLDRRKLLIGLQIASMLLAVTLAVLVQTDLIQLWHIYILAVLLGIVGAIDMPAQQAFLGDVTGMEFVRSAMVLNIMILQISRMIGPALAGWVIGAYGVATAFWTNGLSFLAVIASLVVISSNQVRKATSGKSLTEFGEALRFVRNNPRMIDMMLLTVLITFLGMANIHILPSFATDVLGGNADALGMLMGGSGAGALLGVVLIVPLVQRLERIGVAMGLAAIWVGGWFMIFSTTTWLPLAVLSLLMTSAGVPVVMTNTMGLFQILAPADMRARVLSLLLMVSFGSQPLAALLIGRSADLIGAPLAVRINGLLLVIGASVLIVGRPALRRWNTQQVQATAQPAHV